MVKHANLYSRIEHAKVTKADLLNLRVKSKRLLSVCIHLKAVFDTIILQTGKTAHIDINLEISFLTLQLCFFFFPLFFFVVIILQALLLCLCFNRVLTFSSSSQELSWISLLQSLVLTFFKKSPPTSIEIKWSLPTMHIVQQSSCPIGNPMTVYTYGFIINCTMVGQSLEVKIIVEGIYNIRKQQTRFILGLFVRTNGKCSNSHAPSTGLSGIPLSIKTQYSRRNRI